MGLTGVESERPDKVYLSARRTSTPDKARVATREAITSWKTLLIKTSLGVEFKNTSRVTLQRPAWMPRRLYRWLLGTVIVETLPVAEKTTR